MSCADRIFIDTIRDILDNGVSDEGTNVRPRWDDGTPAHTIARFGVVNRYDLSKEFPIMTLRRTYWKSALDEVLWIWQKKSNRVAELSSRVWDSWAGPDGTIGKAYGYQMGKLSRYKDVSRDGLAKAFGEERAASFRFDDDGACLMDQTDRVIYQLINDPSSRRIMTNMYCIDDLSEMGLAPCAYSMTFMTEGGKLNAILNQRSQDMVTANNWNIVQYAFIVHMMARTAGLLPGELVHVIANCHIYDRHIPIARELIERAPYEAPTLVTDPDVKDFYSFTKDSFSMEGYKYHDFDTKIEVAV